MALTALNPAVRITRVEVTPTDTPPGFQVAWNVETPDGFGLKKRLTSLHVDELPMADADHNELVDQAETVLGIG